MELLSNQTPRRCVKRRIQYCRRGQPLTQFFPSIEQMISPSSIEKGEITETRLPNGQLVTSMTQGGKIGSTASAEEVDAFGTRHAT